MKGEKKLINGQDATILAEVHVPGQNPPYRPVVIQLVQLDGPLKDLVVLRNDFKQGTFAEVHMNVARDCFMAEIKDAAF